MDITTYKKIVIDGGAILFDLSNNKITIQNKIKYSECTQVGILEILKKIKNNNTFIIGSYYSENLESKWSGNDIEASVSGSINKNDCLTKNEFKTAVYRELQEELRIKTKKLKLCCSAIYENFKTNYINIYSTCIKDCDPIKEIKKQDKVYDFRFKKIGCVVYGSFDEMKEYIDKLSKIEYKNYIQNDSIGALAIISLETAIKQTEYAYSFFEKYRHIKKYECKFYD
jgi:hypothetical protein